jgi:hypothetical protein
VSGEIEKMVDFYRQLPAIRPRERCYPDVLDDDVLEMEELVRLAGAYAGHGLAEARADRNEMLCRCGVAMTVTEYYKHEYDVAFAQLVADGHLTVTAVRLIPHLDEPEPYAFEFWSNVRDAAMAVAEAIDAPAEGTQL